MKEISLTLTIMGAGFNSEKRCWDLSYSDCIKCDESAKCEGKKRIFLKDNITEKHLANVIFMEQIQFIHPGMEEELFLEQDCVDLIIIFPESTGSISEYKTFSTNLKLASKLRIFVRPEYHPLSKIKQGVLQDDMLEFLTQYGHVYPFENIDHLSEMLEKLITSFRVVKYKTSRKAVNDL